jgi:hypothetical protein
MRFEQRGKLVQLGIEIFLLIENQLVIVHPNTEVLGLLDRGMDIILG